MRRFILSLICLITGILVSTAANKANFVGGDKALWEFIKTNLRYPAEAAENGIEGKIVVSFTVLDDGTITDPKIERPVDPSLEAEAIRLVKSMPSWAPATDDDGNPVESRFFLPLNFRLK